MSRFYKSKLRKIDTIQYSTHNDFHPTFVFNENDPKDREDVEKAIDYLYKEIIIPYIKAKLMTLRYV